MSPRLARTCATLLLTCTAAQSTAAATLYERLGGHDGIMRVSDLLIERCRSDKRISNDFQDVNIGRLKGRIADFICVTANGPCSYRGRSMAASHRGLRIDEARFNAVVEDLETAMDQAGVPYGAQNALLARLAPMQREIVTR